MTEKTVDELVSEAVAEAVAEVTAQFHDKEKELNRENAKWRRLAQQKDVIDPSELENLQTKIDELQSQLSASGKTQKEQAKLLKQAQDALASESTFTQRLLLDNGLTEALVKANVAAQYLPAVKAMFGTQAKIVVDGDNRKAVINDKDLADFISGWATSDEGKHYVAAPGNGGGGGAGGSSGGSGQKIWTRERFDAASHFERSEFAKAGGKVEG